MLKTYTPDNPLDIAEVKSLLAAAFPGQPVNSLSKVPRGSTNLVYLARVGDIDSAVRISHRPDRIAEGVMFKEAEMLKKLASRNYSIPIPKILWQGHTSQGFPVLIETQIYGGRAEDVISHNLNTAEAAEILGKFTAELHQNTEKFVDEFETDKPRFNDFPAYARYWLGRWRPLCDQATHITKGQIKLAYKIIEDNLPLFTETTYPYVHADMSFENLHARIDDGKLVFTGLCDFETMQTAPPEYDLASIDDVIFLFYPEMQAPFMKGYTSVAKLSENYLQRLAAISLFRALRYIKRSVKYNETHYFDHDRRFLKKWLNKKAESSA